MRAAKFTICAALLLGAATGAQAAEWWYVGGDSSAAYFVDRESIGPVSLYGAQYAKASDTASGAIPGAPAAASSKNVRYYNCADRTLALKSAFPFARDGAAMEPDLLADGQVKMRPAARGSAEDMMIDFVCNAERSEGDRPDFTTAQNDFLFVGDLDKARAALTPANGVAIASGSVKARLGRGEEMKPIF